MFYNYFNNSNYGMSNGNCRDRGTGGQCRGDTGAAHTHHSVCEADYGPDPFVVDIEKCSLQNDNFRSALWTGKHLQVTLMSIKPGEDIGAEVHPHTDQFLRIEEGQGIVKMGESREKADFQAQVHDNSAIFVPAGKWHNITNTGSKSLKLYSIYAPPNHKHGTIHKTKKDAEREEH